MADETRTLHLNNNFTPCHIKERGNLWCWYISI